MTPYKAAFGKKPNLREVREWGEKVWVRVEGGNKLGGHIQEGRWLGLDDNSNGVHVYWPDMHAVSIERNVYFDQTSSSVQCLEGEDQEFTKSQTDLPPKPRTPEISIPTHNDPIPTVDDQPSEHEETPSEAENPSKRIRKPTQCLKDIMEGRAITTNHCNTSQIPVGVQLPTEKETDVVLEGEGTAEWMTNFADEYAMVADMGEMEAIKPRNLTEARCCLDWLQWEKAIEEELVVLDKAGTWKLVDAPPGANIVGSKWIF